MPLDLCAAFPRHGAFGFEILRRTTNSARSTSYLRAHFCTDLLDMVLQVLLILPGSAI